MRYNHAIYKVIEPKMNYEMFCRYFQDVTFCF